MLQTKPIFCNRLRVKKFLALSEIWINSCLVSIFRLTLVIIVKKNIINTMTCVIK